MSINSRLHQIIRRPNPLIWGKLLEAELNKNEYMPKSIMDLCGYNGFFLSNIYNNTSIKKITLDILPTPLKISHQYIRHDLCSPQRLVIKENIDVVTLNNSFHLLPDILGVKELIESIMPEFIFITTPTNDTLLKMQQKYKPMNDINRNALDFFSALDYDLVNNKKCIKFHYRMTPFKYIFWSLFIKSNNEYLLKKIKQDHFFYEFFLFRKKK